MVSAKFSHAATLALLFFVVSSPYTYKFVDNITQGLFASISPQLAYLLKIAEGGCPTTYGLLVHAVVFALVVYYVL